MFSQVVCSFKVVCNIQSNDGLLVAVQVGGRWGSDAQITLPFHLSESNTMNSVEITSISPFFFGCTGCGLGCGFFSFEIGLTFSRQMNLWPSCHCGFCETQITWEFKCFTSSSALLPG